MTLARWPFWVSIALGAFLLFLIQPLIARMILPWFGGAASVWIACMLFFQTTLFCGYLYAHTIVERVGRRARTSIHVALLAASLLLLPVIPAASLRPVGDENPVLRILLLLAATVGLPYLLLASTSPLLQSEYARRFDEPFPYRLFAVSNVASLAGLLCYPVLIEPLLASRSQALFWSVLYGGYVIFCGATLMAGRGGRTSTTRQGGDPERVRIIVQMLWVALPACASAVLFAATQFLSENIAPVPLLWVLPFSAYLLSFVLCFGKGHWYRPSVFLRFHLAAILAFGWLLGQPVLRFSVIVAAGVITAGVFFVSMYCHGELVRRSPDARHLTRFYLMMSAGGALGGIVVGAIFPVLLAIPIDLPLGLSITALLTLVLVFQSSGATSRRFTIALAACTVLAMVIITVRFAEGLATDTLALRRNFYGTLRVTRELTGKPVAQARTLEHGVIRHGTQLMEPALRRVPTSYFAIGSGVQQAIARTRKTGQRVGIIGLGVGTLAAYGAEGDVYRFYEINPEVVSIATRYFSFLADSPARTEVVLGDGRLSLEREQPQNYDVFAVDAFSGDSIPAHLLTVESMRQYLRHLAPGGIIAMHISNKVLDLEPVVGAVASESGLTAVMAVSSENLSLYRLGSSWALLSREAARIEGLGRPIRFASVRAWRDDSYSIWQTLHWR